MKNQDSASVFDQFASSYDQGTAYLAPMREALHSLLRVLLADLPAKARILCVGVGTGSELLALARDFPHWHFTAVEPSVAMLELCRQRVEASGLTPRCTFHEGYLGSLPASDPFDAATCLLVSQFFMEKEKRRNFFSEIASRLHPAGYLVSCDLVSDRSTAVYGSLLNVWLRTMMSPEMAAEKADKVRAAYERDVAVLPAQEVEAIIASGGFDTPVLFFQYLLVHAWYAKRKAPEISTYDPELA
jgi:tRNA (cmo5U34)-methyltransferase